MRSSTGFRMSEQLENDAHLLPATLRRIMPASLRMALGKAVSKSVMLYRDSVDVRHTVSNVAPSVLRNTLKLRFKRPTVGAVFVGRNDDYVADNEARIRAMIEWNTKVLCDEMIFVEWNPLPDKPLLSLSLTRDYPQLRAYVVPPEIHSEVCSHPRMVVMEEFGKNVGLRRAHSEYICVTNSYILWDRNVRRMLRALNKRLVFRTRRIELKWDGQALTQEYLRDSLNRGEFRRGWKQELSFGCGDFLLAHRDLWNRARGYDESLRNVRIHADGRGLLQLLALGGRPAHMGYHYHISHGSSSAGQSAFTKDSPYGESFKYWENLPYENPATWGLGDCREEEVGERVWVLRRKSGSPQVSSLKKLNENSQAH